MQEVYPTTNRPTRKGSFFDADAMHELSLSISQGHQGTITESIFHPSIASNNFKYIQQSLDQLKATNTNLSSQITTLNQTIQQLSNAQQQINDAKQELKNEVTELKINLTDVKTEITGLETKIGKLLRFIPTFVRNTGCYFVTLLTHIKTGSIDNMNEHNLLEGTEEIV
jgi:DNA repair exonuclease SbcCD ATPase subunit